MEHKFNSCHRSWVLVAMSLMFALTACRIQNEGSKKLQGEKSKKAINFIVFGDWGRDGSATQLEVAKQMAETASAMQCEFVISTGDNFYRNGVKSVKDLRWQTSFEDVYNDKSLTVPWYVVLGNHDYRGNTDAQIEYTNKSKRWRMPAHYFTQVMQIDTVTSAQFFFIDTIPFRPEHLENKEIPEVPVTINKNVELQWLDSALAASKSQWKIVVGHYPVYSNGEHGNIQELISSLKPLLEKRHVQIYFNGHDHDLEYIKEGDVNYITSGAGEQGRPVGKSQSTVFSQGVPGFVAATLTDNSMEFRFIGENGQVLYVGGISR